MKKLKVVPQTTTPPTTATTAIPISSGILKSPASAGLGGTSGKQTAFTFPPTAENGRKRKGKQEQPPPYQFATSMATKQPPQHKWWMCCCRPKQQKPSRVRPTVSIRSRQSVRATVDLSTAFCEHTWDLERIDVNYPDSKINMKQPAASSGLSSQKARERLAINGPNCLPEPKEMSNIELFIRQFWNLLWVLLIGASTLSLLQWFLDTSEIVNLYITLILYAMIVVMCTVSWWQEKSAREVIRGFHNLLPEICTVVRDGQAVTGPAQQLVVGDIIRIKAGNRVPADARIIHCSQLKLEASSITGEAEAIDYQSDSVPEESVSVFEARNIAFNGSLCVEGEGTAVVIRVASSTVIGQIAQLTTGQAVNESRLEIQVRKYVKFLIVMACSTASIVFVVGGFVHKWTHVVSLLANGFLVCAIGMVPCGLPATVTSILSLLARRLANKQVYLKRLDVCEALGQVSIIASDKTGTLTRNVMTVTHLWCNGRFIEGYPDTVGGMRSTVTKSVENFEPNIAAILTGMSVCNASSISRSGNTNTKGSGGGKKSSTVLMETFRSRRDSILRSLESGLLTPTIPKRERSASFMKRVTGTPSELAMVEYANNLLDVYHYRQTFEVVFEIPFSSRRKWHLVIARGRNLPDGQHEYKLLMKGAPEILAKMCTKILTTSPYGDHSADFDLGAMKNFQEAYTRFAESGRRVIGFAETTFTADIDAHFDMDAGNFPTEDLTFIGLCAIADPPRPETAESIRLCRTAGIKVFMVTGDHQLTATAIAREIGLIVDDPKHPERPRDYEVICGSEITALTPAQWDSLLSDKQALVFARTTPEQKLHIVEQCQRRKHLIAMTGDGVNDAPALKKADIGIAMGSGSEVAKQAADIILMDDNFSSIVRAVEEGRTMYENIKKLLGYTMPHSFPEVWPIIVNFCFGWPVGITALQILSIDLGTELLPGVSLAREPMENDVMQRPPRQLKKVLVSNTLLAYAYLVVGQLQSLGCALAYLYVFWSHGIGVGDLWMSALSSWQKGGEPFRTASGRVFYEEEQLYIGRQATSAWQMGIVFGQFFNIWSARTRRASLFQQGFCSNRALLWALGVELALINLYVYCPYLNHFLGGAPIPWQCWAIVAAMGIFINVYNELRKLAIRTWPNNRWILYLKW